MSGFDRWFPYRRDEGGFELFGFPHAGAGVTVFGALREALAREGIALSAAMLPGRERRLREVPHQSMEELLTDFEEAARSDGFSAFTGDYGLVGHCSGALIAYELARILERSPCPPPQLVVVCSSLPPPLVLDTGTSRLDTRELFSRTASMGGMSGALIQDADFLDMIERPLRADWTLFDGYIHRSQPKLTAPVLAVRGADDPDVGARALRSWRDETEGAFLARDVAAGHWVLDPAGAGVLAREVSAALSVLRDV